MTHSSHHMAKRIMTGLERQVILACSSYGGRFCVLGTARIDNVLAVFRD